MKENLKIDENYYLVSQTVKNQVTVNVPQKTNHIFVVDVSGSMYDELPLIRTQLKNKLSTLMRDGDTISIVWFSGKNDAGILKEEVEVKSLKQLSDLNEAIDRWLKPIGLTAFQKPLELVHGLVGRIKANRKDSVFSMIFLTDGYNNDCPWNDVISTLKTLENDITSSTFVEYGYYADSAKLTQMASLLGGEKISCDGFDDFEPMFNSKISSTFYSGKKIEVDIDKNYLYDFVFSTNENGILLYNIVDNKVLVNENIDKIYYFKSECLNPDKYEILKWDTPLYAGIYLLSDKLLNEDAEKLFYVLGDNHYYKELSNAYGKQKLNNFKASIKECVLNVEKRYPSGKSEIVKVPDDAYCLMNLIDELGSHSDCKFYPNDEDFKYNRIGRKKISANTKLTQDDINTLAEVQTVDEALTLLNEIKDSRMDLKFTPNDKNEGYPLTDIVWNENRANLSVRIYIPGYVILPKNNYNLKQINTFRYKTYTLIKDGIVNVKQLPVSGIDNPILLQSLKSNGVKYHVNSNYHFVIDLNSLPIINKKMVNSISVNDLANLEWILIKQQAEKKVYDYYKKTLFPKESKSFIDIYGQECTDWLTSIGITDFNGFQPKTIDAESTDFYMSVNLFTKIKGLSSLPKVEDVINKINSNTALKPNESLLEPYINNYLTQLNNEMYTILSDVDKLKFLESYLKVKTEMVIFNKRITMQKIAELKYSLILSKKWFKEFKSFDENKLTLELDGKNVDFTFELTEKVEKI
jgi:hypothetical protein